MRMLIMMAALAAGPAQAYELWCMPTEVCHGTACTPNSDEERSVRITDPDGPQPMMRAFAEDVAMTQTTAMLCIDWNLAKTSGGRSGMTRDTAERTDTENAALIARLRVSPEGQEGLTAFLDKRAPVWAGG